jgi:hypothetical protein
VSVDRLPADSEQRTDLFDRVLALIEELLSMPHLTWQQLRWPTALCASCSGCSETCKRPFFQKITLELCESPEDREDQLAPRGRRVDALAKTAKPDLTGREVFNESNEILQRTSESIETPDHNDVSAADVVKHLVQFGPACESPRCDIREHPIASS